LFKAALPGSEFNDRMDVMDTAIELLDIGVFEELAPGYLQIDTYWHIRKKK
jgi:hypothetical protein